MTVQKTAHVISHSHWDREWYLPFEKHRVRLVELMDALIELLENDPEFRSFHLDGQTIVLEDYLQIRPDKQEIVTRMVREGKLHIGPWYILQDEFLTSSEANIRNLLIGHSDARKFGAISKLGYFPDSFGNMGQAPQILLQAGIDTAVFGRGVKPVGLNNEAKGDYESAFSEMNWQAPDGSAVLGILFANWYNNGMEIPVTPDESAAYWARKMADAEKYASSPHLLFMNGCDHQPVQTNLSEALRTARSLYPDVRFVHSNFDDYVAQVKAALPSNLSTIRGELRSQRTNGWWTLVNTASARVYLKQANQRVQTQLEKVAEPLAVFAMLTGHAYPEHLLAYAWKTLMQNHPHDSICGCSVDEVHREMMTRFDKSHQVAEQVAADSLQAIVSHIDTQAVFDPSSLPFTVFNTSGRARTGVVSIVLEVKRLPFAGGKRKQVIGELKELSLDGFVVKDASGNKRDAEVEDLGVTFGYELPKDRFRQPYMARSVRVNFLAQCVPGLGYRTFALCRDDSVSAAPDRPLPPAEGRRMENEYLTVTIADDGTYGIADKRNGGDFTGLGTYENVGDVGNEYIFRAPDGDVPLTTRGMPADIRVEEHTSFRTVIAIVHRWDIPASGDDTLAREIAEFVPFLERKAQRSERTVPLTITTRLTLEQGVPQLKVQTSLRNEAKDHRLRVLFPTQVHSPVHYADSVFEAAERETNPAPTWANPSNCQHMQTFVNVRDEVRGLTVSTLGLNEYEILRDGQGTIAVTLLRAVRELGDWGVFHTPEAQCLGEHTFEYVLIPHGTGQDIEQSYAAAYQAQIPWTAVQGSVQPGSLPAEHEFIRWSGDGLALSAVKRNGSSEDVTMRWFNMTKRPAQLRVEQVHGAGGALYRSNVLEEEGSGIGHGEWIAIRPAEIVTIGGKRP
ncbi:alpha-mannosidase [Paenibacillus allorhizosphaerae]|uniref:Mannosylglycerate hydrolase n=1 Tax=Paenibacillus allorhizosphaerae TaxID=2849866 RepID=A0ABM8VIQ6_9BACL|nr:alpha-mannosidase [Paenibacillus allorhizosphaerae]CAG7644440.1 Mannosylglycerate hydrolase [Paenibacillus allorhizosphaerae]